MNKSFLKKNLVLIAETNFVLDIAFEQSDECSRLLDFIRKKNIKLVIPEYAFAEADGSILDKLRNRLDAIDSALAVLKQASRSACELPPHKCGGFLLQRRANWRNQ